MNFNESKIETIRTQAKDVQRFVVNIIKMGTWERCSGIRQTAVLMLIYKKKTNNVTTARFFPPLNDSYLS